jgi:tRNA-specific 2-thiouridylase
MRLLARGVDPEKDQSYMLAALPPESLDRVGFPLGEQTKEETRAEARAAGLAVAGRRESQEACFLAGDDYRRFLERQGLRAASGEIRDTGGRALGRHDGYWRFTPGQRRGLAVGVGKPLYVIRTDRTSNTVVVGPREALETSRVEASGRLYLPVDRAEVKLRYRSEPVAADVEATPTGFSLELDSPVAAVARGQIAALYDDGAVVGSGVIHKVG